MEKDLVTCISNFNLTAGLEKDYLLLKKSSQIRAE